MSDSALTTLLQRGDVWRGRRTNHGPTGMAAMTTGFPELDEALYCQGWPSAALTEILGPAPGLLGLRLLSPALTRLPDGMLVFANPPMQPSARYVHAAGMDLQRVLIVRSHRTGTLLRACREAACSGSVALLLLWAGSRISWQCLHQLQLAARDGNCCLVLLTDRRRAQQHSPAALRLSLRPQAAGQALVEILKQPGGWGGQHLTLVLYPELTARPVQTKHLPIPPAMHTRRVLLPRTTDQPASMDATILSTWQDAGPVQDSRWSAERKLASAIAHLPPTTREHDLARHSLTDTPFESVSTENTLETN